MATALQICNSALIKLGAKTISALTGLTTKEFDLCVERYPRLRNGLLRSHAWVFAKIVDDALTTVSADALLNQYAYKHTIPTTIPVARIQYVTDAEDIPVPYEVVGGYIFTNEPVPRLRYIRSYSAVDDAADFPDDFAEALSNLLAADLCISLTQNQSLRDTYLQAFQAIVASARFNGAVELYPTQGAAEDWIASHYGLFTTADPDRRTLDAEISFP